MGLKSVILLSGGLDSAANLALCSESDEPVLALTIRYGQRAADREVAAARALCEYYGVRHEILGLEWLGALGGSSLTESSKALPSIDPGLLDDLATIRTTAKSVWVPNRNGVLINVAAAYAERLGASQVVVGFNSEEAVTFPDNSVQFLEAATDALSYSTANQLKVGCYTAQWDKRRIVAELRRLAKPFPFDRLWSCYTGNERPCGECESCRRLARALGG
jgi:7-cyano-7-deazaguanine synthase